MTTAAEHNGTGAAPTPRQELRRAALLAVDCTAVLALLIFVGHWVDQRRGGGAFGTGIAVFLGLTYNIWKVARFVRFISTATMAERSAATGRVTAHSPGETPASTPDGSGNVAAASPAPRGPQWS